jgi:phosphorylase/glycogen(starch) synthase
MAKRAMETLAPRFNSERMVGEYHSRMYLPTAERGHLVASNGYKIAKELADWKRKIPSRFSSLRLLDISLKGTLGDSILLNKPFTVVVRIDPGKLDPEELLVELLVGKSDGRDFVTSPDVVSLTATRDSKGTLSFSAEHVVRENGQYAYGVRVMPWNKNLDWKQEAGLVLWG